MKVFNWKPIITIIIIVSIGLIYFFSKKPSFTNQLVSKEEIEYFNNSNLLNQIKFKSQNLDSTVLLNVIAKQKYEPVLLLRVPKFASGSCVNRETSTLYKWISKNRCDSIILVVSFEKYRFYSAYSSSLEDKPFNVFNYDREFTKLDKSKKPYLLSMDKSGHILKILKIEKNNAEATVEFLNSIQESK